MLGVHLIVNAPKSQRRTSGRSGYACCSKTTWTMAKTFSSLRHVSQSDLDEDNLRARSRYQDLEALLSILGSFGLFGHLSNCFFADARELLDVLTIARLECARRYKPVLATLAITCYRELNARKKSSITSLVFSRSMVMNLHTRRLRETLGSVPKQRSQNISRRSRSAA